MDKVFKDNPKLDVYFKTSDGEAFYNENDAKNYAKKLKDKKVQRVVKGAVSETETENKQDSNTPKLSYQEALKAIKGAETLEQLEQFNDYPQPSVIKALEEKRAELTANIDVNAEDVNQNQA
ncbi:MAG: hypothetical protein AB7D46_00835 [Flavobacteriaceae bacterium]